MTKNTTPNRFSPWWVSAALLGCGGLIWWATSSDEPATPPPSSTTAAVTPDKDPVAAPDEAPATPSTPTQQQATVVSPPALHGRYKLAYEMAMQGKDGKGVLVSAAMKLTGTLRVQVQQDRQGAVARRWYAGSLQEVTLDVDERFQRITDFDQSKVKAEFAQPFVAMLEPNGRIVEVRFADNLSIASRATVAAVLQAAQYVREDEDAAEYELAEWSLNGPMTSTWTVLDDVKDGRGEVARRWTASSNVDLAGAQKTTQAAQGEGVLRIADGHIDDVQASENGAVQQGTGRMARPTFYWRVQLARQNDDVTLAQQNPDALTPLVPDLLDIPLPEEPVLAYADAIKAVEETVKRAPKDWQSRIATRKQLARTLRAEPKAAKTVAALYRRPTTPSKVKLTVAEALAEAATLEAQVELADLVRDDALDDNDAIVIVGSVAGVHTPLTPLLDALADVAYNHADRVYASQVAMSLGASIGWMAESDVDNARSYLAAYLAHADDELRKPEPDEPKRFTERSNWIGGLGNIASPNALPLILKALDDPDEEIRAAGAHALRFQDGTVVRERMQQVMHQDEAISVRLGILHAAHYMGPQTQKTLVERALTYDRSENVRMEAAYVVSTWLPDAPGFRLTLAKALEQETSLKVRDRLRNYLEPGRLAPPRQYIPEYNPHVPPEYQTPPPDGHESAGQESAGQETESP